MKMLVVALINYAIAMAIEHELQTHPNSYYKTCAKNIRLLLGYMAIVLLALIHSPLWCVTYEFVGLLAYTSRTSPISRLISISR